MAEVVNDDFRHRLSLQGHSGNVNKQQWLRHPSHDSCFLHIPLDPIWISHIIFGSSASMYWLILTALLAVMASMHSPVSNYSWKRPPLQLFRTSLILSSCPSPIWLLAVSPGLFWRPPCDGPLFRQWLSGREPADVLPGHCKAAAQSVSLSLLEMSSFTNYVLKDWLIVVRLYRSWIWRPKSDFLLIFYKYMVHEAQN